MIRIVLSCLFLCGGWVRSQNVYRILSTDTNYYHWVGTPDEIDRARNNVLCDCTYARWERRPDAPDGLYYIYYNHYGYNYPEYRETIDDTICYVVKNFVGGKAEGKSEVYDFKKKVLLEEEYYEAGILRSEVRYEREEHTYPCSRRDPAVIHGHSFSIGLVGGHFITYRDSYDSLGRCTFSNATMRYGFDTLTCYEERARYDTLEVYVVNYHYGNAHMPASEIVVRDSMLTVKRWCKNGELYYHREEKIIPHEDGTWHTVEAKMIVNLLEGEDREWGRWWGYDCKE